MTQHRDLFSALAAPFSPGEERRRPQGSRQLTYVTARTVMNRLDTVLGPENWWDRYSPREHSVTCELTIRLPDGTCLTKSDCGGNAGMADEGDDDKSGFADAFKRAAVKFGVGRYLYGDGTPNFGAGREAGADEPEPEHRAQPRPRRDWSTGGHGEEGRRAPGGEADAPRSGRALFAWTKDQDEKNGYGLLKYIDGWARRQDFPARMVDWDGTQVNAAHREALRRIGEIRQSAEFQTSL